MSGVFLFLDVEMTGKKPKEDYLLEIYCQPVDKKTLREIAPPFHTLVQQPGWKLNEMNGFVRRMHTKTGLLDDLESGLGLREYEAINALESYLKAYPMGVLAGRNVGTFDRVALEEAGADLSNLHFRHLDVSTLLQAFSLWQSDRPFKEPKIEGTKHRARDDVLHDIQVVGAMADYLELGE